jgi:hypothetical protein
LVVVVPILVVGVELYDKIAVAILLLLVWFAAFGSQINEVFPTPFVPDPTDDPSAEQYPEPYPGPSPDPYSTSYDSTFYDTPNVHDNASFVGVNTDNVRFVVGSPVGVQGEVFDEKGNRYHEDVPVAITVRQTHEMSFLDLSEEKIDASDVKESKTFVPAFNGFYITYIIPPLEPGLYEVSAYPVVQGVNASGGVFKSFTTIQVQELFYTRPFLVLVIGGAIGLVGLTMVIIRAPVAPGSSKDIPGREQLDRTTYELLRFIFLTIIAITPILAFALTDVQIAPFSPLGLITKLGPPPNIPLDSEEERFIFQWLINVGGTINNNYSSGIQIPVAVVIFGIAGGYLRFLYYTSTKGRKDDILYEPFYESLKDLSIMFLSPLLAIAVWLVLFQGGTTSAFTLAAISFTIGLVTREVVYALINFVSSKISSAEFSSGGAEPMKAKEVRNSTNTKTEGTT